MLTFTTMAPSEYVSTCVRPSVRAAQDGLAGAHAGGLNEGPAILH